MNIPPNRLLWFVIDDDQDDQEIFSLAVAKVNPAIQCIFAYDGVNALEQLTNNPTFNPGSIFLDVNMPRMNGLECLEELKKMERLNTVPIFMCSTSAEPRIITRAKTLGARDFIVKPSTISEFAAKLTEIHQTL